MGRLRCLRFPVTVPLVDGNVIREARERAGMTQQQLADQVGVSLRTVGNWERGKSSPRNREGRLRQLLGQHLSHVEDLASGATSAPDFISKAGAERRRDGDRVLFVGESTTPVVGGVSRVEVVYEPGPDRVIDAIDLLEIAAQAHRRAIDATRFQDPASDGVGEVVEMPPPAEEPGPELGLAARHDETGKRSLGQRTRDALNTIGEESQE